MMFTRIKGIQVSLEWDEESAADIEHTLENAVWPDGTCEGLDPESDDVNDKVDLRPLLEDAFDFSKWHRGYRIMVHKRHEDAVRGRVNIGVFTGDRWMYTPDGEERIHPFDDLHEMLFYGRRFVDED
jgi:hypothetical protein